MVRAGLSSATLPEYGGEGGRAERHKHTTTLFEYKGATATTCFFHGCEDPAARCDDVDWLRRNSSCSHTSPVAKATVQHR
ncbi:Monomeric sarcosine oxidase [Sesbania bispinosa]|nr:Monomeric sarcosine oxidase [Sesbania bispinosa]